MDYHYFSLITLPLGNLLFALVNKMRKFVFGANVPIGIILVNFRTGCYIHTLHYIMLDRKRARPKEELASS